jgi:peroxiredoxin Q/BCP
MRIAKGEKARKFTGVDFKGVPFDSDELGGKKVLFSFFRYASCPFCNLRIHRLISRYEQYQKAGVEVVAVFQSPPESIRQYVGKQDIPFTVLADPERKLYTLYGVESSWLGFFKVLVTGLKDFLVAWNTGFSYPHSTDAYERL